jgi:hypothetical protein
MPSSETLRPFSRDFSAIPVFAPDRERIHAKLVVGSTDDPQERAADRVADRVMRGFAAPVADSAPVQAQRKCDECAREKDEEEQGKLRRKSAGSAGPASDAALPPPSVSGALASPARNLDFATRSFFEPRFGRSLADIRVHSDDDSARSAQAVSARAYTVGNDIVFAPGQYSPGTEEGRWLLAHEIAHAMQQRGGDLNVLRRQATDGKMEAKAPAPAAGVTPRAPAPPPGPVPGPQAPTEGKLAPLEDPTRRRVQLMTFDCQQKRLAINTGSVVYYYKLEKCSLPFGSYEPTVEHLGNDFKLHFGVDIRKEKERFDFSYYVESGQVNPAQLLAKQDKVDVDVVENLPAPAKRDSDEKTPDEEKRPPEPACVVHLADRELVKPDKGSRDLFKPKTVEKTVWTEPIPLGQFGFVNVDANVSGSLTGKLNGQYGPGKLKDICLTHLIDTTSSSAPVDHPMLKSGSRADVSTFIIGGRARFHLPASASIVITGKAALVIAADYLGAIRVGSIQGGVTARGEAALGGAFDAGVEILARYTRSSVLMKDPFGGLSVEITKGSLDKVDLAAQAVLAGHASLSFSLDAFVAAEFLKWELWRETWQLKKSAKLGFGWEGGIKYSPNPGIHWILGAIDKLEGIDEELFDDEEAYVDSDGMLGGLLDQQAGTQTTPDGLSRQNALPFTWHKPLDMYPNKLSIPNAEEPKELDRDAGPTSVRRIVGGKSTYERIGVNPKNWVRPGDYLQFVPHAEENRREQRRLRDLLTTLGFDRSGTEIDHVRDHQFGGKDHFSNLWPLDQATNSAAGPRHEDQCDNYERQFAQQNQSLGVRIFVISNVEL